MEHGKRRKAFRSIKVNGIGKYGEAVRKEGGRMRLVCQEGLLPGADRREKFHNGRSYGFDGIEIGGRGLKASLTEYQELSHEFGLPVTSVCLGWDGCLLDADPRERD